MMLARILFAACIFPLLTSAAISAPTEQEQSSGPAPQTLPGQKPAKDSTGQESDSPSKQRDRILGRVLRLAARLQATEDSIEKALAIASVATRLCSYDKAQASRLFLEAHSILGRLQSADAKLGRESTRQMYRLSEQASKCDRGLGETIRPSDPTSKRENEIDTLLQALSEAESEKDPAQCAEIICGAMEQGRDVLWQTQTERFNPLGQLARSLDHLRRADKTAAERLLQQALEQISSQPSVPALNLLTLGAYLYSPDQPEGFVLGTMGYSTGLEALALADCEPRASVTTVHRYLEIALDQLGRAADSELEKAEQWVAVTQLLPKARLLAPDLAPGFEGLLRNLNAAVGGREDVMFMTGRLNAPERKDDPRHERLEKEFDAEPDVAERDYNYMFLVMLLRREEHWDRARQVAAKITDAPARATLMRLIDLEEAVQALRNGQRQRAEEIQARMPPSGERAVLRLGLAADRAASEPRAAIDELFGALSDAETLTDGLAADIKLAAVPVVAPLDPKLALNLLSQATNTPQPKSPFRRPPLGVTIVMRMGPHWEVYRVSTKRFSLSASIGRAVTAVATHDLEGVESIVLGLTGDGQLAQAVPPLIDSLLARLPR